MANDYAYIPSPMDIRLACQAIQQRWTAHERAARSQMALEFTMRLLACDETSDASQLR